MLFRKKGNKGKFTIGIRPFLILTSIALASFFLLVESFISYNIYLKIINRKTEDINQNNLQQVTDRIGFEISQIWNLINHIKENADLKKNLRDYNKENDAYTKIYIQERIRQALSEMMLGYGIANTDFYFPDGKPLLNINTSNSLISFNFYRMEETSIYKRINNSPQKSIILPPGYKDESFSCTLSCYTFATLVNDGENEMGILFLQIDSDRLNSIIKKDREFLLINKIDGTLIWSAINLMDSETGKISEYCTLKQGSFKLKINREHYNFYYQDIGSNNWVVLIARKASQISTPISKARNYSLLSFLLSCLLSFTIGEFVSKQNMRPVSTLIQEVGSLDIHGVRRRPASVRRNTSIRDSFMLFYIIVISVPMIIYTVIFYFSASVIIKDIVKESLLQTMNKATNSIDSFIDANETLALNISKENVIQSFLINQYRTEADITFNDIIAIDNAITKYSGVDKSIMQIELYDSKKRRLFSSSDYSNEKLPAAKYDKILESSYGNPVWDYTDTDPNGNKVISLFKRIYALRYGGSSFNTVGYLKITLFKYALESLYQNISYESSSFYILDKEGIYVSNKYGYLIGESSGYIPQAETLSGDYRGPLQSERKPVDIIYSECTNMPWFLAGEIKNEDIMKENGQIISSNLYLVFSMCFLIFILSYIISLNFSKSFDSMSKKLVRFGNGDMNVDFSSDYYFNEIDTLSRTFNKMALRINELTETLFNERIKAEELEKEKKESELIALQAQINPHFLYNTFESIKWMIEYNTKNATAMLTQLGDLFRLGINRKSQFVTLEEEIKYAKTYVDIQKVRYGENITVSWNVDSNIAGCKIPKLILQPLIENAFIHGFKTRKENGNISIYCFPEAGNIVFKIMDNGEGIKKDMLEEINNKLNGVLLGESVGIYNVQKRIRLYYGEDYGITLSSQAGIGTIVRLCIPIAD